MTRAQQIIEKYNIRPPFIKKAAPVHLYTIDFVQTIWKPWGKYSGFYYEPYLFSIRDNYVDVFYLASELSSLLTDYLTKLNNDPEYLEKHYQDWQASCGRLSDKINKFETALRTSEFPEVFATYHDLAEEYILEFALSGCPQEALGFQPELWVDPEVKSYCEKYNLDYQKTSATLTAPVTMSFIAEEELELLELALKGGGASDLSKHQAKWFWMRNNYLTIEILSQDFFEERMRALLENSPEYLENKIEETKHSLVARKEEKTVLFEKHQPSAKLLLYVKVVETFAEMQDVRKGLVLKLNHYHRLFLDKVSTRFSQKRDDLWWYSYSELIVAVETGIFLTPLAIDERRKGVVVAESRDEKIILTGKDATEMINYLESEVGGAKEELKGLIANRGVARGTVKIVLRVADIDKVKEGDILVSSMTRPEMTVAMQKAAAFVTDEGGITCHAAIVARELNKPCIIGTKSATKVFKDGDLVEVDADKGVVRKLQE